MNTKHKSTIISIIPARYQSYRFPGKPLVNILGKTLIQRTYENAKLCSALEKIIVATDDQRIYDHVQEFGGDVVMTPADCLTGTDRLIEVLKQDRSLDDATIIVNIQGDVPFLETEAIHQVINILIHDPSAVMSTAITKLETEEEALDPSVVKCVIDQNHNALYFSRALIPGGHSLKYRPSIHYYKHFGIYAFRRDFLLQYGLLSVTPLQVAEDLEQLKVLEHGYKIKAALVKSTGIDVNTPDDIKKIERLLCK